MPYNRSLSPAPYIYAGMNIRRSAILSLALLLLHLAVMGFMRDVAGIMTICCTGAASVFASFLIGYHQGKLSFDMNALVAGLLIGFFLPTDSGLAFSFFTAFMSYFLSWGVFGGRGSSWINPVMLAVCIAAVCQPGRFVQPVSVEQITAGGSVFAALETAGGIRGAADQSVTSMLNSVLLHRIGVTLPEGYVSLFLLYPSAIPAFRYNMLTLLSSIILLSTQAMHKTLSFSFLAVYGLSVYFFSSALSGTPFGRGDILSAMFSSGAFFAAFFVINDGGSVPRSWGGRLLSGALTGIFAFCIIGPGAYPAGIPFAVLCTDCLNPLIEQLEVSVYKRKRGLL